MATLTVIVPVYKVEPYLYRCVDSILAQTFADFELILVDDGSPDNCPAICDEYASFDSRVRVIHKENGGVSTARNVGLEHACGEYVTFVDSDDSISPDYLAALYEGVKDARADMVVAGYARITPDGETLMAFTPETRTMTGRDALFDCCQTDNSIIRAPWCKLVRTSIAQHHPFPTDRKFSEDFATVYQWMFDSNTVVSTSKGQYAYWLSETGVSRRFNIHWLDNFKTLDEMIGFFESHEMFELAQHYIRNRHVFWLDCKNQLRKSNVSQEERLHIKAVLDARKRDMKSDGHSKRIVRFKTNAFYVYVVYPLVGKTKYAISLLKKGGLRELLAVVRGKMKGN